MTYAAFLSELAVLSEGITKLVEREPVSDMPTPYIAGKVCIHLDGQHVGVLRIEDNYCLYEAETERDGQACHEADA